MNVVEHGILALTSSCCLTCQKSTLLDPLSKVSRNTTEAKEMYSSALSVSKPKPKSRAKRHSGHEVDGGGQKMNAFVIAVIAGNM